MTENEREKCCGNCKFFDTDWMWDDETMDEYEVEFCEKGYLKEISYATEACEKYKRYRAKGYKEKYTECDKCCALAYCKEQGGMLDITSIMDNIRHFMQQPGYICPKKRGDEE